LGQKPASGWHAATSAPCQKLTLQATRLETVAESLSLTIYQRIPRVLHPMVDPILVNPSKHSNVKA